jgi:hypothetical protein
VISFFILKGSSNPDITIGTSLLGTSKGNPSDFLFYFKVFESRYYNREGNPGDSLFYFKAFQMNWLHFIFTLEWKNSTSEFTEY